MWVAGFGFGVFSEILNEIDQPSHSTEGIPFMVASWIVGSAISLTYAMRLKTVVIDEGNLVIKNYIRTIRIPLKNIEDVAVSLCWRPLTICISFYPKSEFGRKILFIPKSIFRLYPGDHPIVVRLRELSGLKS